MDTSRRWKLLQISKGERGKKTLSLCLDQHTPSISIGGFKSQYLVTHSPEFLTLERLCQEVGDHVVGGHVLHDDLALLYTVADKKELMLMWRDPSLRARPFSTRAMVDMLSW